MSNWIRRMCTTMIFGLLLLLPCLGSMAQKEENYERDYLSRVYNSSNGLEGTASNCICTTEDGFLWIGAYSGLFRYDGTEFRRYLIDGRYLPVNDVIQDAEGNLWIGTNGDGVYRYDGKEFLAYGNEDSDFGASVINKLYLDSKGTIWIGTKSGLFFIDPEENGIQEETAFADSNIHDIAGMDTGEKIIVEKNGNVWFLTDERKRKISLEQVKGEYIPRCCTVAKEGYFYIGTTGDTVLKMSKKGKLLCAIKSKGLSSFNEFYELDDNTFWVCSDSGIGLMQNDRITREEYQIDDSVEEVGKDFQGNYWFVSSRQGILELYRNYFSDLGSYWNRKEIVNAIQPYQGKIYVGCDDGLFCYRGKDQVSDRLAKACEGQRIRQLYLDGENNLWVSTYQAGIKVLHPNGDISSINVNNSELTTNQIRCIWQKHNGEILIGTEEGLFLLDLDGKIRLYVRDQILGTKRILYVREDSEGRVFAATDGYGVYELENNCITKVYSRQDGLLSNVVMKVVPSDTMEGTWMVTGEGICFAGQNGNVKTVTGISVANSLDLLLTEDGDAIILADNGFFRMKETDLLKTTVDYVFFNKQDGLPVDFTANARNVIVDGILYMCGTTGAAGMDLNGEEQKCPVILYLNEATEDGQEIQMQDGAIHLSSGAHRLNIDIRVINYVHHNVYCSYFMEGVDKKETQILPGENTEISYTNLDGGSYLCNYKVFDGNSGEELASLSVPVTKEYRFQEEPKVRMVMLLCILSFLILLYLVILWVREDSIKKHYHVRFQQKKEEEISRLAYRDLVTGVYNRNCFEQEKEKVDMEQLYAILSVSINHLDYIKSKYGMLYMENVLRRGVKVLQECTKEEIKIYRVSENIFYFWLTEPVQLENYVYELKEAFQKSSEEENLPMSFSIGAVYYNKIDKETMNELITRCEKMRLLDEKHAEANFIEGKMKLL